MLEDVNKVTRKNVLAASLLYSILGIIGLQILFYIINQAIPSLAPIKFGWAILALTFLILFTIIERIVTGDFNIDKKTLIHYGVAILIILLIWVIFPKALPELFSTQRTQLLSMIGGGI